MLIPLDAAVRKHGLNIKGVLQVGAHFGEEHDTYIQLGIKNIVYIEPCKPAYNKLVERFKDGPEADILIWNVACGEEYGEMEMFVVDDVAFIGATLWTDCDKFNPVSSFYWNSMADSRAIRTGPNTTLPDERKFKAEDTWTDWREAKRFILNEISRQKDEDRKVVVVTHHAPSPLSIHEQYRTGSNSILNMFFCSDMTVDVMDRDPDLWIHGHVHNAFDYLLDSTEQICSTRVVCNPRGYHSQEIDPVLRVFDVNKLIDL